MRSGAECKIDKTTVDNVSSIEECSTECHSQKECRYFQYNNEKDTGCRLVKENNGKCIQSDYGHWKENDTNFYEIKEKGNR